MKTATVALRIATGRNSSALRRLTMVPAFLATTSPSVTTRTISSSAVSIGAIHPNPSKSNRVTTCAGQRYNGNGMPTAVRFFASDNTESKDSHSDFAPQKKKVVSDTDAALKLIDEHVKANAVMLYMKGTPSQPMCGFSARVVGVLTEQGVDYGSVNVLDYPAIREGIKQYSQWPTIPQLYVQGEFVGGCDIITEMHASGELKEVLKPVKTAQESEK